MSLHGSEASDMGLTAIGHWNACREDHVSVWLGARRTRTTLRGPSHCSRPHGRSRRGGGKPDSSGQATTVVALLPSDCGRWPVHEPPSNTWVLRPGLVLSCRRTRAVEAQCPRARPLMPSPPWSGLTVSSGRKAHSPNPNKRRRRHIPTAETTRLMPQISALSPLPPPIPVLSTLSPPRSCPIAQKIYQVVKLDDCQKKHG